MREIPLSQGRVALVDDADFEWLSQWKWHVYSPPGRTGVHALAHTTVRKNIYRKIKMHRLILGAKEGDFVDHIDGNGLNNQKSNLRFCTKSENGMNRGAPTTNSSGFKGVSWAKSKNKWEAYISLKGIRKHLGRFTTKEEAALAYNEAALIHHGSFAHLNKVVQ